MAEIGLAASVIGVLQLSASLISICYNYQSAVRNASKDMKLVCSQLINLNNVLDHLVAIVEDDSKIVAGRLQKLASLINKPDGPLSDLRTQLEVLEKRLRPALGWESRWKALTWPLKESETKKALANLVRTKAAIDLALSVVQTSLDLTILDGVTDAAAHVKAVQDVVLNVEKNVINVQDDVAQLRMSAETKELAEKRRKMLCWLNVPDFRSNHLDACAKHQPTTGDWFLESEQFANWKTHPCSFLWIHGIPGQGKTIMCSTIIQRIELDCKDNPTLGFGYFYFDFKDKQKQTVSGLIRSLIYQLCRPPTIQLNALARLYDQNEEGSQQPHANDLILTLRDILSQFQQAYILLDALDECATQEDLWAFINTVATWGYSNCHILVTSRKEGDIKACLSPHVSDTVDLRGAFNDHDINIHIHETLKNDPKLKDWPQHVQDRIAKTLTAGAQGMFRWVDCQLSEIRKCMKLSSLEKTLGALPTTLDATYDRILTNIDEEYVDDAIRVLQWLAFSARPMTVDEVAETLSICLDDDPRFDPDRRLKDPSDILVICSSLVTVSDTSHYHDDDSMPDLQSVSDTTFEIVSDSTMSNIEVTVDIIYPSRSRRGSTLIQLAHFSVKEYLVSSRIRNRPASRFAINRRLADTSIAQLCLVYLLHLEVFETLNDAQLECLPLAQYAADCWITHARSDNGMIPDSLLHLVMDLFSLQRRMAFVNWARVFGRNPGRGCISAQYCGFSTDVRRLGLSTSPKSIHSALCYANSLGLKEVLKQILLDDNVPVDADAHARILVEASRRGLEAIVTILVGRGREFLEVCLKQASSSGPSALVNLLLDRGADVNAGGGAALQAASFAGYGRIVRLLIDRGADVNASGGIALKTASEKNREEIVGLLIERGADVNASGGAALQAASSAGHSQIICLLIERGADVNAGGGGALRVAVNASALRLAAHAGGRDRDTLTMIMGGNIFKFQASFGMGKASKPSWSLAQFSDLLGVVRLLIELGADVNAGDGAALRAALSTNHGAAVHLLLSNGAKAHGQNSGLLWLQSDPSMAIHTLDKFQTTLDSRTACQLALIEDIIPYIDDITDDSTSDEDHEVGEWELSEVESEEFTSTSDDLASSYRTALSDIDIMDNNIVVGNDYPEFPNVSSDPEGSCSRCSPLPSVESDVEDEIIPSKHGNRSGIIAL